MLPALGDWSRARDAEEARSNRRGGKAMPASESDQDGEGGVEAERGMAVEALLMGKWLPARVVRVGRDGDVDLELDDGTELENVSDERLRKVRRGKKTGLHRATSWECLEALGIDAHARRGGVGKAPKLTGDVERERDQAKRLESLLGKDLARGLRDAFDKSDSMKEGELDVDDALNAFEALHRVASRALPER